MVKSRPSTGSQSYVSKSFHGLLKIVRPGKHPRKGVEFQNGDPVTRLDPAPMIPCNQQIVDVFVFAQACAESG